MRPMREKIQTKLNAMASILLDDIIVPEQSEQEGSETIVASFHDKDGNKFSFTLTLDVTHKNKVEESDDASTGLTISEQIAAILEKITQIENEIVGLRAYHTSPDAPIINDDTNENDGNTENNENDET